MKCVCGYIYEDEYIKRENKPGFDRIVIKGDREFIHISGSFTIASDRYYSSVKQVELYACPKCGTIRMEE